MYSNHAKEDALPRIAQIKYTYMNTLPHPKFKNKNHYCADPCPNSTATMMIAMTQK